jgi:hypothetical protein
MSTVQIRNDMATGIRMRVFGQIVDDYSQGDLTLQQIRHIPVGAINDVVLPGGGAVTTLDATFATQWFAQNASADFVTRHLVYQVG